MQSVAGQSSNDQVTPCTYVGQWLLASAVGEPLARRQELAIKLNGGEKGMNSDEPAVIAAACEAVLRELFVGRVQDQQVTEFASLMSSRLSSSTAPTPAEGEAVMRSTLGVPDSSANDLTPGRVFYVQSLLFGAACLRLDLSEARINRIVIDAEGTAFRQGWHPARSD